MLGFTVNAKGLRNLLVATVAGKLLVVLVIFLLGAAVIALPGAAASYVWDRVAGIFGNDPEWKSAVRLVASYQLPSDRENLLLYRPLWVDCPGEVAGSSSVTSECKPVASDHIAHWMNYARLGSTVYRVPSGGYHSYTFDIGREAEVGEIWLVMACKNCDVAVLTSSGDNLSGEIVARYYSPDKSEIKKLATKPTRYAAANSVGGALSGARYITLVVNNQDNDAYFAQIAAFPPGKRSNALWASLPQLDRTYRNIYSSPIAAALGQSGSSTNILAAQAVSASSFYYPIISASAPLTPSQATASPGYLPIYPVAGNPARAGTGTASDLALGSRKVYLSARLSEYTIGKLDEVSLSWLSSYPPLPVSPTLPVSVPAPTPPFATKWQLYLLDSKDAADNALLDSLFGSNSSASSGDGEISLPAERLLREYADRTTAATITTGKLNLALDDKRDTLVFVFEQSSFMLEAAIPLLPGQLAGLPPNWLALANISLYELPPPTPVKWPPAATGYASTVGGRYDLRAGSISAEKIDEVISRYKWRGILPSGYPGNEAPQPNKLEGKGAFFVEMGQKYKINPAYALAFAIKETSLGTTGFHVYNAEEGKWGYNLYGITGGGWLPDKCIAGFNGRFCGYRRWEDSIEEYFALLSEGYVGGQLAVAKQDGAGKGQLACPCTTIDRILPWYAPYFENDTDLYIQQIKNWLDEWGASGTDGIAGGGSGGPVPAINQMDSSQYNSDYPVNPWGNSTCGVASAAMVLGSFGYDFRVVDLLQVAARRGDVSVASGTIRWDYLTDPQLGGRYEFSYRTFTAGNASDYLQQFRELTGKGQPVIANVFDNYYYAGHFFVVVGYDGATDTFQVNDPIARPISGQGVVQQWPAARLGNILRLGYPAVVITKTGTGNLT